MIYWEENGNHQTKRIFAGIRGWREQVRAGEGGGNKSLNICASALEEGGEDARVLAYARARGICALARKLRSYRHR